VAAVDLVSPFPHMRVAADGIHLDDPSAPARQARLNAKILDRLSSLVGVVDAGGIDTLPFGGGGSNGRFLIVPPGDHDIETLPFSALVDRLSNPAATGDAEFRVASAGYFRAMEIPLQRGRLFDERDGSDAPHVAVISETLARTRWPNQDPIGIRVDYSGEDGDRHPFTIVGIVGDVRERGFAAAPPSMFYADFRQRPLSTFDFTFVLRTAVTPASIVPDARRVIRTIAPDVPPRFRTVEEIVDASIAGRRLTVLLATVFAASALLVAVLGMYGVVAFVVAERSGEFGVRMALGAQAADVQWLVLRQGARLILVGLALGLAAAVAGSRLLASQLFGIAALDPATYASVVALLAMCAFVACEVPALRATRVDPAAVLRANG
jgi:predicted permease